MNNWNNTNNDAEVPDAPIHFIHEKNLLVHSF